MKSAVEQRILWEMMALIYGTGAPERLQGMIGKCNPDRLARLTALTGMEGFIYAGCASGPVKGMLPEGYMSNLHKKAGLIALKNGFIYQNGLAVLELLNEQRIEYILVKGIVTLKQLYDDDMMRAVSDLDILIHREDYVRTAELFQSQGFYYPQEKLEKQDLTMTREEFESRHYEISYVKDTVPFPTSVDLHFDLSRFRKDSMMHRLYPIHRHDWFANTQMLEMEGYRIRCLNNEMALLNMIYHFSIHHSFRSLKWLIDICQMVVQYQRQIDWDKVYLTAEHPNLRKLVGICLSLVKELTGIDSFGDYSVNDFLKKSPEMGWFKKMMFADLHKVKAAFWGRMVRVLLPVTFRDKMLVLGHNLFDKDSIIHRSKSKNRGGIDLLQPFRLFGIALKDLFFNRE